LETAMNTLFFLLILVFRILFFFLITICFCMCHLMMSMDSEKCILRQFCHCGNVKECTYTNINGVALLHTLAVVVYTTVYVDSCWLRCYSVLQDWIASTFYFCLTFLVLYILYKGRIMSNCSLTYVHTVHFFCYMVMLNKSFLHEVNEWVDNNCNFTCC
jgi:hypothetical protein